MSRIDKRPEISVMVARLAQEFGDRIIDPTRAFLREIKQSADRKTLERELLSYWKGRYWDGSKPHEAALDAWCYSQLMKRVENKKRQQELRIERIAVDYYFSEGAPYREAHRQMQRRAARYARYDEERVPRAKLN